MPDGLDDASREVLRCLFAAGYGPDGPHRRCSRIVARAIGVSHAPSVEQALHEPHAQAGNRALRAYLSLVRMAQPWTLLHPLVDGRGNFGSPDGDPPADLPYTECRLTRFAAAAFEVEGGEIHPRLPHALVNGTLWNGGRLPPHNLGEVVAATLALLREPRLSDGAVRSTLPAPDFPTAGRIAGTTRQGLVLQGRVGPGPEGRGLCVTELPYGVARARWIEAVCRTGGRAHGIAGVHEQSTATGLCVVFDLAPEADRADAERWIRASPGFEVVVPAAAPLDQLTRFLRARRARLAAERGGATAAAVDALIAAELRQIAAEHGQRRRTQLASAG